MNKAVPLDFPSRTLPSEHKVTIKEKLPIGNYYIAVFTYRLAERFGRGGNTV